MGHPVLEDAAHVCSVPGCDDGRDPCARAVLNAVLYGVVHVVVQWSELPRLRLIAVTSYVARFATVQSIAVMTRRLSADAPSKTSSPISLVLGAYTGDDARDVRAVTVVVEDAVVGCEVLDVGHADHAGNAGEVGTPNAASS